MSGVQSEANQSGADEVTAGTVRYRKLPYSAPEVGMQFLVRDKSGAKRIVQVNGLSQDRHEVEVVTVEDGNPSEQSVRLPVESLARQAAKGWCSRLLPSPEDAQAADDAGTKEAVPEIALRLDSQNFGRCCGDIARANIKFSTQLIKDVGDGPFRAGDYEQAFLTFEQLSVGFNSAVGNSRRAIAEGRRKLVAEKGKLSGKEIQERTAGFMRNEQLIHTAEREFATILEGLRMYLRAQQNRSAPD
jgi:hypothetical protein